MCATIPMKTKWLPLGLTVAALAFSAVDFAYHYDRLPAQVASHFDAQGHPNGWSSKGQFAVVSAATSAFVAATLLAASLIARFAPRELINLPHKDYWLSDEQEAATRQALVQWGFWFAAATLWLLALVFHDAMVANLRQPPQMRMTWPLLGGYVAVVALLLVQLVRRFARKR